MVVLLVGVFQEQISSRALAITCLTEGSTITAALFTCKAEGNKQVNIKEIDDSLSQLSNNKECASV
jgi:hypothetical protein